MRALPWTTGDSCHSAKFHWKVAGRKAEIDTVTIYYDCLCKMIAVVPQSTATEICDPNTRTSATLTSRILCNTVTSSERGEEKNYNTY